MIGGLKGNSVVNIIFNIYKIAFILIIVNLVVVNYHGTNEVFSSFFPPISDVIKNLGIWGVLTNILFNLSWQFVDNSSWQSVIGGADKSEKSASKNLKWSGILIFSTIGVLGTILGYFLSGLNDVSPDNLLLKITQLGPYDNGVIVFCMILFILTSIVSLLDGMLMTAVLTISKDILNENSLIRARIYLFVFTLFLVFVIPTVKRFLGLDVFDFVYFVIISQLALIGPVVITLIYSNEKVPRIRSMWIPIVGGIIAGMFAVIYGATNENQFLVDGAGTLTIISSILLSSLLINLQRNKISRLW